MLFLETLRASAVQRKILGYFPFLETLRASVVQRKFFGGILGWGVCTGEHTGGVTRGDPYHDTRLRSGPEFLTVNPSLPSHTQISSYKNPYYSYMGKTS